VDDELTATADPAVFIEEQRDGYVRYRNTEGRRWEVHGTCDRRLYCMVGAIVNGRQIMSVKEARALPPLTLDSPVTPEFTGCCPFRFVELDRGD
jgi:hypothetical protein